MLPLINPISRLSILKIVVKSGMLQKKDVHLVATLIRDAEKLNWLPGQLERRKQAVKKVLASNSRVRPQSWSAEDDNDDRFLRQTIDMEDALFKRKGWNRVDAGFRLLGGGSSTQEKKDPEIVVDKFLESKGWNDVDSGFRLF